MAELELEQARSFAFAVDAAFKEAQRGMCADATKQGECRALKAIRDDIWAVEGKIREAKWATDAGDKAFLSKQIDPLMQQVLDKCETHRDEVQTCQELLQDIHNWCEQRGTSAHRVRVEPSAAAKATSVRYSGDCAGAGAGTASSRIPGYRSPTKQRAAQQQASGAADRSSSQQPSGVKAMAAGFSRIPQPQKQQLGRRASLPDAQQRPQDTTDQAQASSEAQQQQQSAAATTGQERLSRNSSGGGSIRGSGGSASNSVAAAGPAAAGSGSASKDAAAGGVGARVAPRSLLQMEPSRDDVALSSAGQLLQQSSGSGTASTQAVAAPSIASASAAPASHVTGGLGSSAAAAAAATGNSGSPARSLHAQLMTPPGHAVAMPGLAGHAPAHITRADELAALEAAYGPVDELTHLPPLRGALAAGGGGGSSYRADHSALMQQHQHQEMMGYSSGGDYFSAHPGSSHHTMLGHQLPPQPYFTSSTAAYQHLQQLQAVHLLGSSAGGGGLMMGAGGGGIDRSSADVAAILQRSGLMESALLASTSRVHVVHDAVAHKPTRKPGQSDVPDVPVVPASLAVQHKRRRQPRSLLGRLVRAVAGTVVAAAVTTAGVVAYKEAEENGLLAGKLGQRSSDGSRQQSRWAAAASDALLFAPMGPAPDASAGCG